ncbi:hypothetical protein OHA45_24395 [Streptomyces lydicus]|uniref:hypothetical protein n=1 Tax=Streptomyces lydicus TaxID=47763 RepID=UPI002E2FF051|nr:hypothetical protein [Streptomyces lydicus]
MRTTIYRVLGPTWGIAIDLTAGSASVAAPPPSAQQISNRVWLDATPVLDHSPSDRSGLRLTPDEVGWLRHGLSLAAEAIEAARPPGRPTLVTVHRVLFPEADFQPEGLAAAIIEWSQKEFSIPPVAFGTSFDRAANRFVFTWRLHQRPQVQRYAGSARPGIYAADPCRTNEERVGLAAPPRKRTK